MESDYLVQSILSTSLDDTETFAFLYHLHGYFLDIHTVMNLLFLNLLMDLVLATYPNSVTYVP